MTEPTIYRAGGIREKILDVVRSIATFEGLDVTAAEARVDDRWINLSLTVDGVDYERHLRRDDPSPNVTAYAIAKGFQDLGKKHRAMTEEKP